MDMLPAGVVDAIIFWDQNPPLWAEWFLVALFAVGVVALLYTAARPSSSETLNARNEREMQEARR